MGRRVEGCHVGGRRHRVMANRYGVVGDNAVAVKVRTDEWCRCRGRRRMQSTVPVEHWVSLILDDDDRVGRWLLDRIEYVEDGSRVTKCTATRRTTCDGGSGVRVNCHRSRHRRQHRASRRRANRKEGSLRAPCLRIPFMRSSAAASRLCRASNLGDNEGRSETQKLMQNAGPGRGGQQEAGMRTPSAICIPAQNGVRSGAAGSLAENSYSQSCVFDWTTVPT